MSISAKTTLDNIFTTFEEEAQFSSEIDKVDKNDHFKTFEADLSDNSNNSIDISTDNVHHDDINESIDLNESLPDSLVEQLEHYKTCHENQLDHHYITSITKGDKLINETSRMKEEIQQLR